MYIFKYFMVMSTVYLFNFKNNPKLKSRKYEYLNINDENSKPFSLEQLNRLFEHHFFIF